MDTINSVVRILLLMSVLIVLTLHTQLIIDRLTEARGRVDNKEGEVIVNNPGPCDFHGQRL